MAPAPKVTIGQIAQAAEVNAETIRQWFKRRILTTGMRGAQDSEGDGLARHFSPPTALLIAIMAKLSAIGVKPALAFKAAQRFSHTGEDGRRPAHLFPAGQTVAIVGTKGAQIVNVTAQSSFATLFADAAPLTARHTPLAFLPLDELVDTVRHALGLPRDPLSAVKHGDSNVR